MKDITRDIFIGNTAYTVFFIRVKGRGALKYFVSVYRAGSQEAGFEMIQEQKTGKYRVLPPAPPWAIDHRALLSKIIEDESDEA